MGFLHGRIRVAERAQQATQAALLAFGLLVSARAADAACADDRYVYAGVTTQGLIPAQRVLAPGDRIEVETENLAAGATAVIHLWDPDERTEIARASDGGDEPGSARVVFSNGSAAPRRVVLFVRGNSSGGTVDLRIRLIEDGEISEAVAQQVTVAPPLLTPCGAGMLAWGYETALIPNGSVDTALIGLDENGRMVAYNDDGGIGAASRLSGRSDICQVVLNTTSSSSAPAPANLYVNDLPDDRDGDNLGRCLERELGTCDAVSGQADGCPAQYDTANLQDTDRDGIPDDVEVFGVELPSEPSQLLPQWGASPLHKDVFVEVDITNVVNAMNFNAAAAAKAASFFAGSNGDERNPDGLPGVSLHVDNGLTPADPTQATLFGAWGGSNQLSCPGPNANKNALGACRAAAIAAQPKTRQA
jgi:hypothetical protein